MLKPITGDDIRRIAGECGFELAGVAAADPHGDFARFEQWREAGMAGEMRYLTDRRGDLRVDPRNLLETARSIVCVGKLYNTQQPLSTEYQDRAKAWISRYAWGADYHEVVRAGLEGLVKRIREESGENFEWKICVDTAPLLERSYAREAGLGWVGRNTCLINEQRGSWFVLGEVLLSIAIAPDTPPPDRCGTCRRCIDACPTDALVPDEAGGWRLDARLCLSYLTIEQRGEIPEGLATSLSNNIFGCDICQDVCPWNRRAPFTEDEAFAAKRFGVRLEELANLTENEFRQSFKSSPVWRSKHAGFLRNVAVAMGNAGNPEMLEPLQHLAEHPNGLVATTAKAALSRLGWNNDRVNGDGCPELSIAEKAR